MHLRRLSKNIRPLARSWGPPYTQDITIYTYFPVEGFLEYCSLPPQ